MGVPRFFVPGATTDGSLLALPDDEAHHLRHVLRLEVGASIVVFDGLGREWRARISEVRKGGARVELLEETTPIEEPPVKVTLGIGVLKGDQMDTVVRDATALGASAIAPFVSEHVAVPSRSWQRQGAIERWQRVAVSSAKQCRRAVVPRIGAVRSLEDLLSDFEGGSILAAVEPLALTRAPGIHPPTVAPAATLDRPATALALIGPEGGWSPSEVHLLRQRAVAQIEIGPRTLRAEIVPTVLLTVLWTMWGW